MADTVKVLAQAALSATTLTDVDTVSGGKTHVVSSVILCNRGNTDTTFRVSVAIAGAANTNAQYLYYDTALPANKSFIATIGITLAATDVLRAYAGSANVSVNVFGVEV